MERSVKFTVVTLFFFILFIPANGAQKKVTIALGDWSPFLSEQMEGGGVLAQIVTEAFESENIKVEYKFFPWKRAILNVEEGLYDASPGWTKTPEREQKFFYSDPVFESRGVFFHLKSTRFDWRSVDDLKGIPVGGTIGYDYGEVIQKAESEGRIKIERSSSDIQNFKLLLTGRIQIFPQVLEVGYDQLKRNFTSDEVKLFTHHNRPYRTALYYLIMSKKNPENEKIITAFNRGLKKIKDSGKFDEIFLKGR